VSKPLIVYNIFVIALICYGVLKEDWYAVAKNSGFLVIGSLFIWVLCFLGFEPIVWVLFTLPIFFVVAILALLVLTQIIKTNVSYSNNEMMVTGLNFKKLFGITDELDEVSHDMTTGFFAPQYPDDSPKCKRPSHVSSAPVPAPAPAPVTVPVLPSKERITGMLQAALPEECTTCVYEIDDSEN